jgi:hypothetical protein
MDKRERAIEVVLVYPCYPSSHTVKTYRFYTSYLFSVLPLATSARRYRQQVIYIVAVKFRNVYDSEHPLWLTRLLPGSGGACILKTKLHMRESTGSDFFLGLASSAAGLCYIPPRLASSLRRHIDRPHDFGLVCFLAAYLSLDHLAAPRYA